MPTSSRRPHVPAAGRPVRRVAMLSVHTSPLDRPGTGDAGGMNVYVLELARRLAAHGIEVDVFTRSVSPTASRTVIAAPGVRVWYMDEGGRRRLAKEELPAVLTDFTASVLRTAATERLTYQAVHSHYWLSGQVGVALGRRWDVPLIHSMHTMARTKNAALAAADRPEPDIRILGECALADTADRLVANTHAEAAELVRHYGTDAERIAVVHPGVDLGTFRPADGRAAARRRLGLPPGAVIPMFAGRIQPLKGPDVLLHAVAVLLRRRPELARRLIVPLIGGNSGTGTERPDEYRHLAAGLGLSEVVRFLPALGRPELADWYRAADVVVMPSHSESFGLVALEAQACGTPVLAAAVGGLTVAVRDGVTGHLVQGHRPEDYAAVLGRLAALPGEGERLGREALRHARCFGWDTCARATAAVYAAAVAERAELGRLVRAAS
ncbi:D-inositol-3-phosphate glycosyltransferase [Kitasatospora cathayae]|uniref:D-inositol-3-phosphate glycosyltransferase n=1 Tax=Kitasatospora cathayae TaxID=3004092 RepID=A0ABY7PXC1_9ACTN|nr:D-inositol-3-phosphate glycosyltransferase [Kitasatospora sp. HUAS 3-15]WBP85078.1 D-inositol-3-phosphate glycosyltransferase [Kitasatospora sp. HUAS 3-15]